MKIIVGVLLIFLLTACGNSNEPAKTVTSPSLLPDLEKRGREVAEATDGAVVFVSVQQTTSRPLNGYQIKFETDREELMSSPGAEPGNAAFYSNTGRTEAWSARFCTPKLKSLMARHGIDIVIGDLTNSAGTTQSMSIC